MKRVLILQPQLDQSLSIAKYLKKYSDDYYLVGGYDGRVPIFNKLSRYDGIIKLPSDTDEISKEYDLIIPAGAQSTYHEISQRGSVTIGNVQCRKANLVAFDKVRTLEIVDKIGIPIPITYSNIEAVSFPAFFKQDFERGGGIRGIVREQSELKKLSGEKGIIFQEYIDSIPTYGVAFLAHEGNMITSFIQKELLSYPRSGGSGVILTSFNDSRLTKYAKRIIQKMNLSGWGLIEFKYCPKRDDYVFMEVNAKFWASIELTFMNNPTFLKELFDIDYVAPNISNVIFMNRLAYLGISQYFQTCIGHDDFYKINVLRSMPSLVLGWLRENGVSTNRQR